MHQQPPASFPASCCLSVPHFYGWPHGREAGKQTPALGAPWGQGDCNAPAPAPLGGQRHPTLRSSPEQWKELQTIKPSLCQDEGDSTAGSRRRCLDLTERNPGRSKRHLSTNLSDSASPLPQPSCVAGHERSGYLCCLQGSPGHLKQCTSSQAALEGTLPVPPASRAQLDREALGRQSPLYRRR